ncbi:P2Y purinoceptor 1-like [Archocentrus centrarchus]|uniref:P2Y purinoceptor 1-like n=1 Tax=Archocentrus centrarchus TaxID=63155 RepID=UPI0011EA0D8D|nr:P2Y purinoceptor 1-like [Archocentrus centrarchus]
MVNSTCISFDFTGKFLPPVYILVFIIGMVANGWGLRSLLQKWEKLGNIGILVFNLGLADILYLLTLPFLMVYYFKNDMWIFGDAFCKITRFCFNLNLYGSIGFLTCISVYRYLAIVHPMRVMGRIRVTYSVAISVTVWLLVSAQSLPDMFYPKASMNRTEKCFDTTSNQHIEDYLKYSLGRTLTGFLIPLFITLSCYGHMIAVLCRNDNIDEVLKQRSLKLLYILILLFSVCYIPYHVFKNLNLWSRRDVIQGMCHKWSNGVYIAQQISRGLVCLNSALNPLVYLHLSEDICSQFRQLFQQTRQAVMSLYTSTQTSVVHT